MDEKRGKLLMGVSLVIALALPLLAERGGVDPPPSFAGSMGALILLLSAVEALKNRVTPLFFGLNTWIYGMGLVIIAILDHLVLG